MPLQTAVNPKTNETAVLVGGAWQTVDQVAVNPTDQSKAYLVGGKWLTDTGTSDLPAPKTGLQKAGGLVKDLGKTDVGLAETGASLASGMVATPVAGIAGIGQGLYNKSAEALGGEPGMSAADRVRQVQSGMTYQPRTEKGQQMTGAVGEALSYATTKPGEWVGEHSTDLAQKMGASPELAAAIGAAANATTQLVPQLLAAKGVGMAADALRPGAAAPIPDAGTWGKGGGSAAPGAPPAAGASVAGAAATAAGRAKGYVDGLGLDWNKLSVAFKDKLTGIAADAQALGRLKPEQVKRQALLAEVGIDNPTKGQVTRDPLQRRDEAAVKATDAGEPLRQRDLEHNRTLLEGVERLRSKVTAEQLPTGSKARGDLPVGRSVQDTALRTKEKASIGRVNNLYKQARKTEPDATAPADALYDLLGQNPHIQHLGWVNSWLKRAKVETEAPEPAPGEAAAAPARRGVTLNELNDLRQEANGIIRGGGTDAHYASQVKAAVDAAMETVPAGAKAWKEAIGAYRNHQKEFADQQAVRGLVEDKPHSSDRRVAIEETAKKTVMGKLEDLQKVKRSLLTGKDAGARAAGKTAWRDLKGWGLDYIRERMTRGAKNQEGEGHTTWVGLKRALDDIGDENLDELYGASVRKQLRRYQEAAETLWTEPSTRVTGSPTFEKLLRFLDRVGSVPGLGKASELVSGTIQTVSKLGEIGKTSRQIRDAGITPLDEQLTNTRRDVRRSQNLSDVKRFAPAAPAAEARKE